MFLTSSLQSLQKRARQASYTRRPYPAVLQHNALHSTGSDTRPASHLLQRVWRCSHPALCVAPRSPYGAKNGPVMVAPLRASAVSEVRDSVDSAPPVKRLSVPTPGSRLSARTAGDTMGIGAGGGSFTSPLAMRGGNPLVSVERGLACGRQKPVSLPLPRTPSGLHVAGDTS